LKSGNNGLSLGTIPVFSSNFKENHLKPEKELTEEPPTYEASVLITTPYSLYGFM
jgi:hypothetical protein